MSRARFIGRCRGCSYDTGHLNTRDEVLTTIAIDGGSVGTRAEADGFCPDCHSEVFIEEDKHGTN